MSTIRILPDDTVIETLPGETLLQANLRCGITHAHACGGLGHCSTCRIRITDGIALAPPRTATELTMSERLHFPPEIRLACQVVAQTDMTIRRLIIDEGDVEIVNQTKKTSDLHAVGELCTVALLFADVKGFTPFAEALPPYDVIHALNRYFYEAGKVVDRFQGRIDNYMGDGLLAVFAELAGSEPAALRAARCALSMFDAIERLDPYQQSAYGKSFTIRVGVHVGEVVVGAVGAPGSRRMSVIGDAVNLASRIEQAGKTTGASLLISEQTLEIVRKHVRIAREFHVELPGKTGRYALYELVGMTEE